MCGTGRFVGPSIPLFDEIVIDFAGAQDDRLDTGANARGLCIAQHRQETRARRCANPPSPHKTMKTKTRLPHRRGHHPALCGLPMSESVDCAASIRSKVFGLITTSGLRYGRCNCRRSTWKYCAGVVQFTTSRLGCSLRTALGAQGKSRHAAIALVSNGRQLSRLSRAGRYGTRPW
jgi:hypothetical protein